MENIVCSRIECSTPPFFLGNTLLSAQDLNLEGETQHPPGTLLMSTVWGAEQSISEVVPSPSAGMGVSRQAAMEADASSCYIS